MDEMDCQGKFVVLAGCGKMRDELFWVKIQAQRQTKNQTFQIQSVSAAWSLPFARISLSACTSDSSKALELGAFCIYTGQYDDLSAPTIPKPDTSADSAAYWDELEVDMSSSVLITCSLLPGGSGNVSSNDDLSNTRRWMGAKVVSVLANDGSDCPCSGY